MAGLVVRRCAFLEICLNDGAEYRFTLRPGFLYRIAAPLPSCSRANEMLHFGGDDLGLRQGPLDDSFPKGMLFKWEIFVYRQLLCFSVGHAAYLRTRG